MQIDIDFEVFKALTALRTSEADSYNDVLRSILRLPMDSSGPERYGGSPNRQKSRSGSRSAARSLSGSNSGASSVSGTSAIFNGFIFPEGTLFRATYKGVQYKSEIRDGRWVDQNGVVRSSPSDAASAISGTNVNGWRFWFGKLPDSDDWVRLDELR
ncbi:hypothetical protein [Qipengyuania sp. ASV99]|uniref:DUF4357 domain-containing protein n=1 Tax=Qipengyuania sp. ASV99 TaxID=3399681 RepID=UPI003A4C7C0D